MSDLARAARLYQDAVWVAEGEADLSWLFLVSAIETAADAWYGETKRSPAQELRELRPEVAKLLEAAGGEKLLTSVAQHFAGTLGAMKKFLSFLLEFLPPPPAQRPPAPAQVDCAPDAMRPSLRKIYDHRSDALHGGVPFPPVMCQRPHQDPSWTIPAEAPTQPAFVNAWGVWRREDTPMYLHTFEYVTRGALLEWWNTMVQQAAGGTRK